MMPKPHFSWSQFYVYNDNPERYYMEYVLGVKKPPTQKMTLGSIAHKAFEGVSEKEWMLDLIHAGFTPDYKRGIYEAARRLPQVYEHEAEIRVPCPLKTITHEGKPLEYLAYLDGLNLNVDWELHEYKTGAAWNQKRVDEHEQLTFYAMLIKEKYGKLPKRIFLHHITLPSGKLKTFETRRTGDDIRWFKYQRLHPTLKLIQKQVFHRV